MARNEACQTVGCVAGIALMFSGYDFEFSANLTPHERDCGYRESAVNVIKPGFSYSGGRERIVHTAGAELGLSTEEREYLFYDCTSTQKALEYLAILIERVESEEKVEVSI